VDLDFTQKMRIENMPTINRSRASAFTLVELLVVISIMIALMALAGPMLLRPSVDITQASADLEGYITLARNYAMSRNTYVRVLFSEDRESVKPSVTVLAIASADGTLQNDSSKNMSDPSLWTGIGSKHLVLKNIVLDDNLIDGKIVTEETPRVTFVDDVKIDIENLTRTIKGQEIIFDMGAIQIQPSGEMRLDKDVSIRSFAVGLVNPDKPNNPALLQINGYSGSIKVLRAEDGVSATQLNP
jgi:Tfp pilus assembly protein FimT